MVLHTKAAAKGLKKQLFISYLPFLMHILQAINTYIVEVKKPAFFY